MAELIGNSAQLLQNLGTGKSIFKPTVPSYAPFVSQSAKDAALARGTTNPPPDNSAADFAKLNAEIKALQNQIAQTPKLPAFDIMANYNRARGQAESAVNPLYERKLREFLDYSSSGRFGAPEGKVLQTKRQSVELDRADVDRSLSESLEDSEVTRARTVEDVAAALERIGLGEDRFQVQEGRQNDASMRNLAREVAASGLTGSMGSSQVREATRVRNEASQQQTEEFQGQRDAKQIFQTRTFEDLARSDTRVGNKATAAKKGIQLDLDSYIDKLAFEEQGFRLDNEAKRLSDIVGQTEGYRTQGVAQFLASIRNSVRPQDFALAMQTYR